MGGQNNERIFEKVMIFFFKLITHGKKTDNDVNISMHVLCYVCDYTGAKNSI